MAREIQNEDGSISYTKHWKKTRGGKITPIYEKDIPKYVQENPEEELSEDSPEPTEEA